MKKLLFTLLLACSSLLMHGQKLHMGLKVQPQIGFATSDTDKFESAGSKIGFDFGLIADYMFAENFGFGSGLSISGQNFKMQTKGLKDTTIATTYKLQYIQIPLTFKFKTNKIGEFKYWANFGISADVNIKAKGDFIKTAASGTEVPAGTNKDIRKNISFYRTALLIGAGIEYEVGGNASLLGGFQYSTGFSDLYTPADAKFMNSYVGLTVGVIF